MPSVTFDVASSRRTCQAAAGLSNNHRTHMHMPDVQQCPPSSGPWRQASGSVPVSAPGNAPDSAPVGCVIQFQTRTYYCMESEGNMSIDVVRLGDASKPASATYTHESGSAVAGVNYKAVSGELHFAAGDTERTITVPIFDTNAWNPTLEFSMYLTAAEGATLGINLFQCRVWIIDKDRFPSSYVQHGNNLSLLLEYFRYTAQDPVVRSGSLKTFAIDQLPNLLYVVQLALSVQLVDHVLQPLTEQGQQAANAQQKMTAMVYGLIYALPIFVINTLRLSKCWLGVGGAARKLLQVNLLRKYVNLTTKARTQVGRAGFIEALSRYSYEVVDHGYMRLFDCAKSLGKIIILLVWALSVSPVTLPVMLLLPSVLVVRIYTQEKTSTELRLKWFKVQDLVIAHADDMTRNFELIRDYQRRPLQAKRLERVVKEANFFSNAVWEFDTRSALMAPTLATLFAGVLVIISPYIVGAGGYLTLGEVLAALQAVTSMGDECELLFQFLVQIQHAISALLRITTMLNLPTDVGDRLRVNRWRRHHGRQRRHQARELLAERRSSQAQMVMERMSRRESAVGASNSDAIDGRAAKCKRGLLKINSALSIRDLIDTASLRRSSLRRSYSVQVDDDEDDEEEINPPSTARFAADMVDIEMHEVSLHYSAAERKTRNEEPLHNVSLKIGQGRIVAVVGAPSSGKATLLRLLAGVVLPSKGHVFAPPHLMLLHVEQQPQLMMMNLAENLWFGRRAAFDEEAMRRTCKVCETLGLPESVLKAVHAAFTSAHDTSRDDAAVQVSREWGKALTLAKERSVDHLSLEQVSHLPQTHAALVHLARALIASPEVLVLHRPLALLDEAVSQRVLSVLRAFVRERGLALDAATRTSRRLRTVVFSCRSLSQALEIADDVIVTGLPKGSASMFTAEQLQADAGLRTSVEVLSAFDDGPMGNDVDSTVTAEAEAAAIAKGERTPAMRALELALQA